MQDHDDLELLRRYAEEQSDVAFAALVQRHINLVFSAARRAMGNSHQAEEITQAVFIILARKARDLRPGTILSGWLYETARLTAANFLRAETRRRRREQEAHMPSLSHETEPDPWPQIAPLLEQAVGGLNEKDRNAIVLRFFEGKSLSEVGRACGTSEDAAKMRVNRALEKLRRFFARRGLTLSSAVLAGIVSEQAVQAAPAPLAASVAAGAVKGSAVTAPTIALVKGTLKLMPPNPGGGDDWSDAGRYYCDDRALSSANPPHLGLTRFLEGFFGKPVLDQTGLTQHFRIDLRWPAQHPRPFEVLEQAVLDQLGLELGPGRAPVELLVVEKAR